MHMNKDATLEVTKEDIKSGQRGSLTNCPFALAGTRLFGQSCKVDNWYLYYGNPPIYFELSDDAQEAIRKFDAKKRIEPGTYRLTVP